MRPKDENGLPMKAAHLRLPKAELWGLEQAGVLACAADRRFCFLPYTKRIGLVRRAIDHVIDGTLPPAWVFRSDPDFPENHAAPELWQATVKAVRGAQGAS